MIFKRILCLMLCLVSLLLLSAGAYAGEETEEEPYEDLPVIFDEQELLDMTEAFIENHHVKAENFSVGFVYTATGDTWFYNEDKWYYSASFYKVPLMMIFAEKVAAGEMTLDSQVDGVVLSEAYDLVLTQSSNYYGHHMMDYLGGDRQARLLYQNYSDLPKEDYDPDFYDYSYFSARFMTDVMTTLYYEQERFPNVIDSIMHAQDDRHFELSVKEFEIAQKYGAYEEFYHNSGIIYTPNPIILVVMTEKASYIDTIFADYARMITDYALGLDEKLAAHEREIEEEKRRQEEEAARIAEEERLKAEEEERLRQEEEAARIAEEERLKAEEEAAAAKKKLIKTGLTVLAGAAVLGLLVTLVISGRRKRKKAAKAYGRYDTGTYYNTENTKNTENIHGSRREKNYGFERSESREAAVDRMRDGERAYPEGASRRRESAADTGRAKKQTGSRGGSRGGYKPKH